MFVGIDFDLEWSNALATVQPALTTVQTNYDTAVDSAVTAYESSIDSGSSTYDSLVAAADIARDMAHAAADSLHDTNTGSDQNDYDNAVNGPGGITETWQNAIDAADLA